MNTLSLRNRRLSRRLDLVRRSFIFVNNFNINFSDAGPDFLFTGQKGLIEEEVKRLEIKVKKETCAICFDEKRARFRVLPCSHLFHPKCIDPWLKNEGNCPLCRASSKK